MWSAAYVICIPEDKPYLQQKQQQQQQQQAFMDSIYRDKIRR